MRTRSLLIVEDNIPLRQMLTLEFEEMGYDVAMVGSCKEAMLWAERKPFDLALLDYELPDGLGTELMTALQKVQPHLRVLICSANPSAEQATAELGCATAFVHKPVGARMLNSRFKAALDQAHINATAVAAPGDTSNRS
ncbi:MAG: response regulator [Sedimenticola sp.]